MLDVFIIREESDDHGTFGILTIPAVGFKCFSIELPWRQNSKGISCIPRGSYKVELRRSPRYGWIYWIQNVPDRNWVLIHPGNFAGDTTKGYRSNSKGCILLGASRGILGDQKVVLYSRPTVNKFMDILNNEPFKLHIKGVV